MACEMSFRDPTIPFSKAALLLHEIERDDNRLDLVRELQRMILRGLVDLERRSKRLKRARSRLSHIKKSRPNNGTTITSKVAKGLLALLGERDREIERLRFFWRCFGDGIAFVYQSKYSLKHLYYDKDYLPKESAGSITGKAGFRLEYKVLRNALRHNVPAVLCDLTNVLRHGDVCLLGGPDPFIIEIKSSKNRNARTDRQLAQLQAIRDFFTNDCAAEFRGQKNVFRVEQASHDINYQEALNVCAIKADEEGCAVVNPEAGLHYMVYRTDLDAEGQEALGRKMGDIVRPETITTFLSATPEWGCYYPFTLSLKPSVAVRFMQDVFRVAVFIDAAVFKEHFKAHGVKATFLGGGAHAIQLCKLDRPLNEVVFRISQHLFMRIAVEFLSMEWFAKEHSRCLDDDLPWQVVNADEPVLCELPDDLNHVKDFFDRQVP